MPDKPKRARWSYRTTPAGEVMGPFDLVELAGLLRTGDVTGATETQREGEEAWLPFQDRPEYAWARDTPADVIYRHLAAEEERESPVSPRRIYYFFAFLGGLALYIVGIAMKAAFVGPYYAVHHDSNVALTWLLYYLIGHRH